MASATTDPITDMAIVMFVDHTLISFGDSCCLSFAVSGEENVLLLLYKKKDVSLDPVEDSRTISQDVPR
jgi:hypothetical protein